MYVHLKRMEGDLFYLKLCSSVNLLAIEEESVSVDQWLFCGTGICHTHTHRDTPFRVRSDCTRPEQINFPLSFNFYQFLH